MGFDWQMQSFQLCAYGHEGKPLPYDIEGIPADSGGMLHEKQAILDVQNCFARVPCQFWTQHKWYSCLKLSYLQEARQSYDSYAPFSRSEARVEAEGRKWIIEAWPVANRTR